MLGAWLLLDRLQRQSGLPLRRSRGMLALVLIAGLLAVVHGAGLYYVVHMDSLNEVSCCCGGGAGNARLQPAAYYLPWLLPGPARGAILNTLFFAGAPLLAAWLLIWSRRPAPRLPARGLAGRALLLLAAMGLAAASLLEFAEVLAPLLMRLPFHHCLYCLLFNGRAPDAPLIVGNVAIGTFAAGWAAVLGPALRSESLAPAAWRWHCRLCRLAATALSASVLMVAIHLLVYHG
jgi:hypothetical protein